MEPIGVVVLTIALFFASAEAATCETGWATYKDELCIKTFDDLANFEDAKAICENENTATTKASLVMVKEYDLQEFLANYTRDNWDNIWLGGKYDNKSAQFKWNDGTPLTYTNWQDGYPRNVTDTETCIELRPPNAKGSTHSGGKWADSMCQRRNLVICQRSLSWTLEDAVEEIKKLRKWHAEDVLVLQEALSRTQSQLADTTSELDSLKQIAITNVRFGARQNRPTWRAPGFPDASGYLITGVANPNQADAYLSIDRRNIQKYVNGSWVAIGW